MPRLAPSTAAVIVLCLGCARMAPGIRYHVEPTPERPSPGWQAPIGAIVEYAAGRGRLDVIQRDSGVTIRVDSTVVGPPLAEVGDYYLFDTAGYVLVRPRTKTFTSFRFAASSYAYTEAEGRKGWPRAFGYGAPAHLDTVSSPVTWQRVSLFWHMQFSKKSVVRGFLHELARGRTIIDSAPAGEALVARWFGPTEAIASFPGGFPTVPAAASDTGLEVTSGTVLGITSTDDARAFNLTLKHFITGLTTTRVSVSRLVLPRGFTEAPMTPKTSPDDVARWRVPPG